MPNKRHLRQNESSGAAEILDGPGPASVAHTPAAVNSQNVRERSTLPTPPRDSMQGISARLGATYWATNKRFDWARDALNHHYEFTRYYFQQLVLLDVWPNANPSSRKESEKKRASVEAENRKRIARNEKPIGLIMVVRGTYVPEEIFEKALRGETSPLIEPALQGALV
jgi:hypothetical protein